MVIDPRGFGDDVVTWAGHMTMFLETQVENMPRLDDPEEWRTWAGAIFGDPDEPGQDSPDPEAFDTWQEWAERLFQTQDFTG